MLLEGTSRAIGVVNPLVDAITACGGICLPCDFNLRETASGLPVSRDMTQVIDAADAVVATGMTLSNGTFDVLLDSLPQAISLWPSTLKPEAP